VGSEAEWGPADCNGPTSAQSHCARVRHRRVPLGRIVLVRPDAMGQKNLPILSVPPHHSTCRTSGGECGTRPASLQPNARRRTPQTVSLSICLVAAQTGVVLDDFEGFLHLVMC